MATRKGPGRPGPPARRPREAAREASKAPSKALREAASKAPRAPKAPYKAPKASCKAPSKAAPKAPRKAPPKALPENLEAAPPEAATELIAGVHPVLSALARRGKSARRLLISQKRLRTLHGVKMADLAEGLGLSVTIAGDGELEALAPGDRHQGVILEAVPKAPIGFDELLAAIPPEGPVLLLALDHVEDPRNLGALMRSAAAFGALGVIVPKDRGAPLSQAARAASAGASEALDLVRVVNLPRTLKALKKHGFWVVAADTGAAEPLEGFAFPERCVLVLGSEGRGLGREVARSADLAVQVSMVPGSPVSSLNVSCAGAILARGWAAGPGPLRRGRRRGAGDEGES